MVDPKKLTVFPSEVATRVMQWFGALEGADERVIVIVSASKLDELVTRLLKASMAHQGGGNDDLFDHDRPLGTFSSRILLAYRLGLIDRDFESFLQVLRRLRNDAAHSSEAMDLQSSPHIERIERLQMLASKSPAWNLVCGVNRVIARESPPSSLFHSLVVAIFCCEAALLSAEPLNPSSVCHFRLLSGDIIEE